MRKFITKVILFVIIVFFILLACDVYVSYDKLQCERRPYSSWYGVYNDTTNYDLVINGSSRAWVQYSPMILDTILNVNSYNLGIDGSCIDRQMVKYHKYCQYHGQPKYLIQNLDHMTMGKTNGYERYQFYPYCIFDRSLIRELRKTERFSYADLYVPYYRYLKIYIEDHDKEALYKGYRAQNKQWDGTVFASIDTIKITHDLEMITQFSKFIMEQKYLGTKIIFVYAPIYYEVTEKCYDRDIIFDMYDSIATLYDIPILNYMYDNMCKDTTCFYNATHLNKKGAELFSLKLAQDMDSLGMIVR